MTSEHTPQSGQGSPGRSDAMLACILAILAFGSLNVLAPVAIPLILALFVTLMVLPLDRALCARLPNRLSWMGRAGVMIFLLAILTLFLAGVAFSVSQIATNLPAVPDQIGDLLPEGSSDGPFAGVMSEIRATIEDQAAALTGRFLETATGLAQSIAGAMGAALAGMVLVLFLIILALSEAGIWAAKRAILAGADAQMWRDVARTLGSALRRFIMTRALVGVLSAGVYTLWLLPFGLDLLLVWAVLTFLMNFIPNLGALISGVFPTVYAFLTLEPGTALLIGMGLIVIEQVIGNWVDPRLQGSRIALSPLVILIAVVFWGWLWGAAGAFLGTPMTLSLMVCCNAIPSLRPVALFLSNQNTQETLDEVLAY